MKQIIKTFKVYELLKDYVPTDPTNDVFDILLTKTDTNDDGQSETVTLAHYPFDLVIGEILRNYATFDYTMFYIDSRYNSHNQPVVNFVEEWSNYKRNMLENWTRIAIAYSLDYNPIHNYDRHETGHRDYTNDSGIYTDSTSNYELLTDAETTYDYPEATKLTTTNYATTYDDTANPKISGKTETNGKYTVTNKGGNSQNKLNSLSTTGTEHDENYTNIISGNIGITTSQEMITSEYNLRKLNLLQHIIRGFAEYALTYSPAEEEDCDDCYFF